MIGTSVILDLFSEAFMYNKDKPKARRLTILRVFGAVLMCSSCAMLNGVYAGY